MKLQPVHFLSRRRRAGAWALLTVMSLSATALMVLAGVISWANTSATTTARNNEYFATSYAAEAATEKILSSMSQQYQNYQFAGITPNMATYQATLPTSADSSYWTNYAFSGGTVANQIIVTNTATSQTLVMGAPYTGLTLVANTYEIIANARNVNSLYGIVSTVGQQINFGTIPLFQFAIFYQNDMEIAPGAAMTISGTVHGNANIYLSAANGLTFTHPISAVGSNILGESPLNPTAETVGPVNFNGYEMNGVDPLNLPVGTNTAGGITNMSANVYGILQVPTSAQTPTSSTGTNLLYNKADMIIIISNNNTISVTSGAGINNQATVISNSQWSSWLNTNGTFYDQRDSLNVNPVVLNVSNLVNWSATNAVLRPVLTSARGSLLADVQSIYIVDERSTSNASISTNYSYTTNYTTNVTTTTGGVGSYPANGTFIPPVTTTNTTPTTSGTKPSSSPPLTYVNSVTNLISYSTNHTYTTNHSTHVVTTNTTVTASTNYSYALITGYTYSSLITTTSTNATALTNWSTVSQPGIVLSNGAVLPPNGLSIATPDPAYIDGNWNIKSTVGGTSDAGLADTTYTHPSAIFSDAITVLSSSWNPNNSAAAIGSRTASSDTVNAAFLTGNVPSDGNYYSGGVENFPRFLENWSGQTFTYNGSMVSMFTSQIANAPWPGTGTVYNPPTRTWAFDNNFNNPSKQPPMTPQVITVQRNGWQLLKPYATSF